MSYILRFISVISLLFVVILPGAFASDRVVTSRIVPSKTTDTVVSPAPERGVAQRVNPERTTSEAVSSRPSSRGATSANGNARRDSATNRATSSAVRVRTTTTPTAVRTSDAQSGRAVNARGSASSRAATTNASRGTVARTSSNIQSRVASSAASRAAATRAVGAQNRTATGATARTTSTRNASTRAGNTVQSRASVLSRMFSATRKVDNAATKSLTDTISAMEDDKQITDFCKAQYSACMDNFCNVLDDAQGRCSCSKNIKNYAKSEEALKQANELLQDVAQQIQYIGLTRDEVETLFTQTAAEQAMQGVTDNSQIKTQLDKIYDMMVEVKPGTSTATDTTDTGLALDLNNLLDFTFDSTGFDLLSMFSTSEQSSSISNQRGEQLYKTAASRCKATVLDACRSQGVDVTLITNSYDLEIDKSCIAYERSLTDGNAEMRQTVRNAQNVLQRARLMVRQQKNTYDLRGCVTALDACMQDEFVCGTDYENCLDPSGKYIVNGEVVIGSTPGQPVLDGYYLQPGYQYDTEHLYSTWNYDDTNAWLSDGSLVDYIASTVGGIPDTTSEDMSAFLQYKIGYHDDDTDRNYGMCMSVLNKCQDITYSREGEYEPDNNVIREYLQRTMTQIKVRQDAILAEYAESCIPDVKSCLSQNGYTTAPNIAINACRQQVVTCMSVTGDANGEPTPSIISQWVDDVQNGITERKQCERSGGTYNTSTGKCSCSASGLRVSTAGTSCECTNGGVWRNGSCYVAPIKCGLDQTVSGCTCYNEVITVNGVKWCVSTSTKNDYMLCTAWGDVRGTWDTVNMLCDCPSNSGWTNGGCACNSGYKLDGNGVCVETEPGGEDPDDNTAETKCKNGGAVSGTWSNDTCTCNVANSERVTSNGYAVCNCKNAYSASGNSCVYNYADQQSACVTGGDVKGTWNTSTHSCKCPSNSSNSNDQGCNCINGYEPDGNGGCRQSGQQPGDGGDDNDAATACESGDLVGQWNGTSCDCPSGASVDTDGSCKCGDGFVAQNNACVVSENENPYGSGFTVQKTLWDNDTEIAIALDDATGICYATVADSDGNFNVSAGTACIVDCNIATATADICENAVIMNNASSTQGWALYAMRNAVNGGIDFSFGDTNVNSLKMALASGELPENIYWVKGFTEGTEYKLLYAVSDGVVYYDANGIRQRTDSVSELEVVFEHKDSDNLETCQEGDVRGEWNFYTHTCDCSGYDGMTSNGDYACACETGYEPNDDGVCVKNETGGDDVEPDEAEKERLCTESNGRWGGGCDCTVSQGGIYNPDTYSCICNVDQGFEAGVPSERGGCTCLTGTAERIDGIWTCKNETGGEGGGNEGGDDTGSAEETACTESGGTWTNGTCACETGYEPNDNGECVEKESGGEGGDDSGGEGGGNEGGDDSGEGGEGGDDTGSAEEKECTNWGGTWTNDACVYDDSLPVCGNGQPIENCICYDQDYKQGYEQGNEFVYMTAYKSYIFTTSEQPKNYCYRPGGYSTDMYEAYKKCMDAAETAGTYWRWVSPSGTNGGQCLCREVGKLPSLSGDKYVCTQAVACREDMAITEGCRCATGAVTVDDVSYCLSSTNKQAYDKCMAVTDAKWDVSNMTCTCTKDNLEWNGTKCVQKVCDVNSKKYGCYCPSDTTEITIGTDVYCYDAQTKNSMNTCTGAGLNWKVPDNMCECKGDDLWNGSKCLPKCAEGAHVGSYGTVSFNVAQANCTCPDSLEKVVLEKSRKTYYKDPEANGGYSNSAIIYDITTLIDAVSDKYTNSGDAYCITQAMKETISGCTHETTTSQRPGATGDFCMTYVNDEICRAYEFSKERSSGEIFKIEGLPEEDQPTIATMEWCCSFSGGETLSIQKDAVGNITGASCLCGAPQNASYCPCTGDDYEMPTGNIFAKCTEADIEACGGTVTEQILKYAVLVESDQTLLKSDKTLIDPYKYGPNCRQRNENALDACLNGEETGYCNCPVDGVNWVKFAPEETSNRVYYCKKNDGTIKNCGSGYTSNCYCHAGDEIVEFLWERQKFFCYNTSKRDASEGRGDYYPELDMHVPHCKDIAFDPNGKNGTYTYSVDGFAVNKIENAEWCEDSDPAQCNCAAKGKYLAGCYMSPDDMPKVLGYACMDRMRYYEYTAYYPQVAPIIKRLCPDGPDKCTCNTNNGTEIEFSEALTSATEYCTKKTTKDALEKKYAACNNSKSVAYGKDEAHKSEAYKGVASYVKQSTDRVINDDWNIFATKQITDVKCNCGWGELTEGGECDFSKLDACENPDPDDVAALKGKFGAANYCTCPQFYEVLGAIVHREDDKDPNKPTSCGCDTSKGFIANAEKTACVCKEGYRLKDDRCVCPGVVDENGNCTCTDGNALVNLVSLPQDNWVWHGNAAWYRNKLYKNGYKHYEDYDASEEMDIEKCHGTPGCMLHRFHNGGMAVIGDLSVSLYDLLGCIESGACSDHVTPGVIGWTCAEQGTYAYLKNPDGTKFVDNFGRQYQISVPVGTVFNEATGRFNCAEGYDLPSNSMMGYDKGDCYVSGTDYLSEEDGWRCAPVVVAVNQSTRQGVYRYARFGETGSSVDDTYADHKLKICWTAESATATEATTCPVNDVTNGFYEYTSVDDFSQTYFTELKQDSAGNLVPIDTITTSADNFGLSYGMALRAAGGTAFVGDLKCEVQPKDNTQE